MASGRWTTRRAERVARPPVRGAGLAIANALAQAAILVLAAPAASWAVGPEPVPTPLGCQKPVYLTLDTGHMGVAPLMAEVLKRQQVRVTFFAANERTQSGDGSLGKDWAPWWTARAGEGHEFASHTWDHVYWRADMADMADVAGEPPRFRVRASSGTDEGREQTLTAAQYCEQIDKSARRLREITGQVPLPLFRAPGGKTSPRFLAAMQACGWRHVGWAPAGFLGDELPSESASNEALLRRALQGIRSGDILMAHLGIWSRKDPWAPAVLEPLIVGLKARGFCFETLRAHPAYRDWIAARKR